MRLTKYTHACFTLETAGQMLVVDPGKFTKDFIVTDNIAVVVITHEHADHFDPDRLAEIYNKNPTSVLVSLATIVNKMPDHPSKIVTVGDTLNIGPFHLEFFGGTHAEIHASIPLIENIGVLVNNHVYYPGDSFAQPNQPVAVLALPVSAPWLKISEAIEFMIAVHPKIVFPTHTGLLSQSGLSITDTIMSDFAQKAGIEYYDSSISTITTS